MEGTHMVIGTVKDGRYYRSLTRNMTIYIILVAIAPMLLVSGIILYQFESSYEVKHTQHIKELMLKHKQNIDSFLTRQLGMLRFLADSATAEQLADSEYLHMRLVALNHDYGPYFVDLGLVDERGVQVSYAGPFMLEQASYADAAWFQEAMERDYYISDVFMGLREQPHFIVTVHVDGEVGAPMILRATVDFDAFTRLVESVRVGETGFAYIVNQQGEPQTRILSEFEVSSLPLFAAAEAADDTVTVREMSDDTGQTYITASTVLKDGDWTLVYRQNRDDAFRSLQRTRHVAFMIVLLSGLIVFVVVFWLARRLVGYVAKADREKESMDRQVVEAGRLASIGELAAGIAHEINNPVAIMVEEAGWIEDLLQEEVLPESENMEEFKRALEQIRTQGRRCKEITHKLLHFARKTDMSIQRIQINDMVRELASFLEQRAKFSQISLQLVLEEDLPPVEASQSELQQVMLNLINNSLDVVPHEGGEVTLSTALTSIHGKPFVIMEVSDNGPGIPDAIKSRIFDPFFTTKPQGKGTGLGLSICYGIIKKLGGDIHVHSTVGAGTVFTVLLPAAAKNVKRPQTNRLQGGAAQKETQHERT